MDNLSFWIKNKISEAIDWSAVVEAERQEFIRDFPVDKILDLSYEDFLIAKAGVGNEHSFCRRLRYESRTASMGNAWPNVFEIYYSNGLNIKLSTSYEKKYGEDFEEAFIALKKEIVKLLHAAETLDIKTIEACEINSLFKYKLLSVYYLDKYFPVCTKAALKEYVTRVGLSFDPNEDMIHGIMRLVEWRNSNPAISSWNNTTLMMFCDWLWSENKSINQDESQLYENNNEQMVNDMNNKTIFDHNTILYGPPGTGKTYNTVIYAVAIVEGKDINEVKEEAKINYKAVKVRYEEYKTSGQIAFTTFHQSYGYEEFIEGIRPVLDTTQTQEDDTKGEIRYEIKRGIFRAFCENANRPAILDENVNLGINRDPVVWKISLEGAGENETRRECMEHDHIRIGWDEYGPNITEDTQYEYGGKAILDAFINQMRIGDIVLSCYSKTETDAIGVITGDYEWDEQFSYYRRIRKVKWLVKNIRENILKINNGSNLTLSSVYKMKISTSDVLEIVKKYSINNKKNDKNYVFIIDEINRGNISKIFGELITLIETTKRLDMDEAVKVTLPYSGVEFGVPSNVYILGTMNTADRSIALMDTALRRRFSFIEMMPEPDVLMDLGLTGIEVDGNVLDVPEMLRVINRRIEFLFDREHTIGHAFFTGLKDNTTIDQLKEIFKKNVIPLLQEYFYEDYEKIQLVLGDNKKSSDEYKFVIKKEESARSIFNGSTELEPMNIFSINEKAFDNIESYIEIYRLVGAGD